MVCSQASILYVYGGLQHRKAPRDNRVGEEQGLFQQRSREALGRSSWQKMVPLESSGITIGGLMSGSSSSPGCNPLARRWLISSRSGISIETSAKWKRLYSLDSPNNHNHLLNLAPLTMHMCLGRAKGCVIVPGSKSRDQETKTD